MNQEQVLYKFTDVEKLTGELLLKMLNYILEEGQGQATHFLSRHKSGEMHLNDFLATTEDKTIKNFLTNEVNFEQLRSYLKEYGIDFSPQKLSDGTMNLAFKTKDKAFVEQAFERLTKSLTDPNKAQELTKRLLKTPKNMSLEEKLSYYQQKNKEAIAQKAKEAKQVKAPSKDEVVRS